MLTRFVALALVLLWSSPLLAADGVVVPAGDSIRVSTPLSKGPIVWVNSTRYHPGPTPDGEERILRSVDKVHEIVSGDKSLLRVTKQGTSSIKIAADPRAAGQRFVIRVLCQVEQRVRGEKAGAKFRAKIEIQVLVDLVEDFASQIMIPGGRLTLDIPHIAHIRRVTSVRKKSVGATLSGQQVMVEALQAGKSKVTISYWLNNEASDRYSRTFEVHVFDEAPEVVYSVARGEQKRISFADIAEKLKEQRLVSFNEGDVTRIEKSLTGPARLRMDKGFLVVTAGSSDGEATALLRYLGRKRKKRTEAIVRLTVVVGDAAAPTAEPQPVPEPAGDDGEPAEEESPGEPSLEVLSKFGAPSGADYVGRTTIKASGDSPLKVKVVLRFLGKNGENFGEEVAAGPKEIAPGKKARFKAVLKGAGPVVDRIEVFPTIEN